jgi:hypothetical protein
VVSEVKQLSQQLVFLQNNDQRNKVIVIFVWSTTLTQLLCSTRTHEGLNAGLLCVTYACLGLSDQARLAICFKQRCISSY